jgi:hypothetical protein
MRLSQAISAVFGLFVVLGCAHLVASQDPARPERQSTHELSSGVYEGVAKGAAETKLVLNVIHNQGKVSGHLRTPQTDIPITDGKFDNGKLVLKFGTDGKDGSISAILQGEKLTGDWTTGGETRPLELRKILPVAEDATAQPVISLSGEWDGLADAQGQGFPFVMTLKVDGEVVTGESNSSLGSAVISKGSFKDGKLVFQLDLQSGTIYMNAVFKDGGLLGEFDYLGQAQGRWVAKKRSQ